MSIFPYWQQQSDKKPLFPDIEWSKPQQRSQGGKLGIIGGNKLGFLGVAKSYEIAKKTPINEVRILLPDTLEKVIPIDPAEVIFGASTKSGGLAQTALSDMKALGDWANSILLIGDCGQNSETAILYESFLQTYKGQLTIARDAVDLLRNSAQTVVERPNTLVLASFAQLQKLFQTVYYPKVLIFSMQLTLLIENLHKFTITYPVNIITFHQDTLVLACGGEVVSQKCDQPTKIWRGITATNACIYWLWNPKKPLKSIATSLLK